MALLASRRPLAAAPMAGGPTTARLCLAVAAAGGFPFVAGGYKTPDALAEEVETVRRGGHPFGVNLFVPDRRVVDADALARYAERLAPDAARYGVTLDPTPVVDDDAWDAKLALLLHRPVPVVSLTFALPPADEVAALRAAGTTVLASVTTPEEAERARATGVDGLVVQGPRAGGHSATLDPDRDGEDVPTADLVRAVRAACPLPVVAAGGVDGPRAVAALLDAGAETVAVGTMLLRVDEAGTSAVHRAALADPRFTRTALTRAFTGRPARALRNAFVEAHDADAITAYPAVHHLTRAMRQAAAAAGDPDGVHLWAGTGWRHAPTGPVAEVLAGLDPHAT